MTEPILTLLTPTWNRRHLLGRMHASLLAQGKAMQRVEWVVVDDGSTDGTLDYIKDLADQSDFSIRVLGQENGGKHRAVNAGVQHIKTPWTLILDSDDWIVADGLRACLDDIDGNDSDTRVLGIISERRFEDEPSSTKTRSSEIMTFSSWKRRHSRGDTAIVVRTEALRSCPFPEFEGETFVAESAIWSRIFRNGGIRLSDATIVGAEYQDDGLSSNATRLRVQSPIGAMFTYRCLIESGVDTIRSRVNYSRFRHHARRRGHLVPPNDLTRAPHDFAGWMMFQWDRRLTGSTSR